MRLWLVLLTATLGLTLATGCGKQLKSDSGGGGTETTSSPLGGSTASSSAAGGSATGVSFTEMVDGLDASKNTALAVKQFWEARRGTTVTWSGEVKDVKASRGRAEIYFADASRPLYRGYNVILQTTDLQAAGALKRGTRVKFQGLPARYSARVGNPVVVTLNNGQIVNN